MTLQPHMEILSKEQKALWPALKNTLRMGFVLYGGTAVALRLGHRESVDFDFFSSGGIDRDALRNMLPFVEQSTVLRDQPDTFSLGWRFAAKSERVVLVSFFGPIGIGRVGVPDITADGVLQVASLDDLMATKLKVLLQRVEAKDYRDVAAMVRNGVSLKKGLAAARAMYGPAFQPGECLKALVFFEGGDLADGLPKGDKETLIAAVADVRNIPDVRIVSRTLR